MDQLSERRIKAKKGQLYALSVPDRPNKKL